MLVGLNGYVRAAFEREPAFVDEGVMEGAEGDQVLLRGRPAVHPMDDVMQIDVSVVGAARELAMLVAQHHRSAERRRDRPSFSADVERIAIVVFTNTDEPAITSESPKGLGCDAGAVIQERRVASIDAILGEMHDELGSLRA